jgi:hypothetical protein
MSRNSLLRSAPDLGPVDAVASARNLPVLALRGRGIKQARIPNERYGDYSAVAQENAECVVREMRRPALAHLLLLPKNSFHPSRNCVLCGLLVIASRALPESVMVVACC